MPKYTMRVQISGTRNGADWPKVGGTVELPESEGEEMTAAGLVLPGVVKVDRYGNPVTPAPEAATAPTPETTKRKAPAKRSVKASAEATKASE
ncbi:hypothetical protein [Demequina gelatinilytica]|uniref:hypothetical protein n=1 Tax=Demequina gelatinilytica TaxID=1638980 RepID=UPI0007866DBB|nr:hypothetical protein [Demequina gelatinilytica]